MALNVPAGDVKNLDFGPGIIYITSPVNYTLGTPNIDIGYCRGAQFQVTRTRLDVYQGSPEAYITTYATRETASLQAVGLEWDLDNLRFALGAGTVSGTDFSFGGDITFSECAIRFLHKTPNQGTIDLYIWRCQGQGENTVNWAAGANDLAEFTFNFNALIALSTWTNNALPATQGLFRLRYIPGP